MNEISRMCKKSVRKKVFVQDERELCKRFVQDWQCNNEVKQAVVRGNQEAPFKTEGAMVSSMRKVKLMNRRNTTNGNVECYSSY